MKRKIPKKTDRTLPIAWWIFGAIVLLLVLAIRIRLLGIPLERDEGEYAYVGQLMLEGIPPYKLAYNMKFPGTSAAYAAIMTVFGQSITGIHFGLLLVNAATIALIFFLGRRIGNTTSGIVAAIAYAILSVSPSVLGLAAHATHFVVLPVLGGVLLLLRDSDRKATLTLFASGLLMGIAVLMKQPALFFVLLGPIYLISNGVRQGFGAKKILLDNVIFGVGTVIPFFITCLLLWFAGVFDRFWFWTFVYARRYAGLVPLSDLPQTLGQNLPAAIGSSWLLWLLAGYGLVAGLKDKEKRVSTLSLVYLLAVSILALSSGLYFRSHYFILVLPAISLLVGVAINQMTPRKLNQLTMTRFVPLCVLAAAVVLPIDFAKAIFFTATPVEVSRTLYLANPFPESIRIAEYLRSHTESTDTIGILGSEPEICFYSERHSASGFIYTYSLMEAQGDALSMQEEMIREIEQARPKYMVFVKVPTSWLASVKSPKTILKWSKEYLTENYDVAGVADIVSPDRTDYYFEKPVPASVSTSVNSVVIYVRKT